jgi:acyl-CoA thioester hydrolase
MNEGVIPPHRIEFRVRYAETDQMGVVYHTNYLIWCEMGRTDFIRSRGLSYADIEQAGVGLAVAQLEARYNAAARYDQLVRVTTTVRELRSRTITFDYIVDDVASGTKLCTASTVLISIDRSGRPMKIPDFVRALFTDGR